MSDEETLSVYVTESQGKPYRGCVGYDSSRRFRTYMYDDEKVANNHLTRLQNKAIKDFGKRKAPVLTVARYQRVCAN